MLLRNLDLDNNKVQVEIPTGDVNLQPALDASRQEALSSKEGVVRDLHVGCRSFEPGNENPRPITGKIKIKPGACTRIHTAEFVKLPADVFGLIVSKFKCSSLGLLVTNAKVDPGYENHLNLVVFNTTKRTVELLPGQAFCSIYFLKLAQPVHVDRHRDMPNLSLSPPSLFESIWSNLTHPVAIVLITFFTSIATTITSEYLRHKWSAQSAPSNLQQQQSTSQTSGPSPAPAPTKTPAPTIP